MTAADQTDRLTTGVQGLDTILYGGLIPARGYMLRGEPRAGKTLLALHFLTADGHPLARGGVAGETLGVVGSHPPDGIGS